MRELYYRLREAGIQPWIDEEDLLPGQQWQEVIREAVQAARIVVVCLSRKSIDKRGFFQVQIQYALDVAAKKTDSYYVVPTRLEPCDIPARLAQWQWVDLFDPRGFDKLLRALGADPQANAGPNRDPNLCSVVLDGSQFSVDLMLIAREAGFNTREVKGSSLPLTQPEFDQVFSDSGLIILVRGDHFQSGGNLEFFRMINGFVAAGGFLFATPWVSWETYRTEILNDVLPFTHPDGDFEENLPMMIAVPGGSVRRYPASEYGKRPACHGRPRISERLLSLPQRVPALLRRIDGIAPTLLPSASGVSEVNARGIALPHEPAACPTRIFTRGDACAAEIPSGSVPHHDRGLTSPEMLELITFPEKTAPRSLT